MAKIASLLNFLHAPSKRKLIDAIRWRADAFDRWLRWGDNWWVGKYVELRGNVIRIDDCSFSVDSPAITTKKKSNFLFGGYELPEREALAAFLDSTLPVIEFGGSVGVVSCLTNRKLNDPRRHVVVEANPQMIPLLEANKARNQCQFTVVPALVAYGSERAIFFANKVNFLGSTAIPIGNPLALEAIELQTTSLQSILKQYNFDQCTLICDIEGGEAEMVANESAVLRESVDTLILEVHEWSLGKEAVDNLLRRIQALGFDLLFKKGETVVFKKARTSASRERTDH